MDASSNKKRKSDENGTAAATPSVNLTPEDARKVIDAFNQEQLIDIVAEAMCRDEGVLNAVRQIAGRDPVQRRLFIRGLGWDTTTEKIRSLFSNYGDLEEAVVVLDKATGKSKGYGFITFRHIDGALLALKEPSKKIDGRMTVTQLAAAGPAGPTTAAPPADVSQRKLFVGNVPANMSSDRLLALFGSYGEIEEGPIGFDKHTGKFRGYALFVYKTVEAAQAALDDPVKIIDGNALQCKLAIDGKKGRPVPGVAGAGIPGQPVGGTGAEGLGGGLGTGLRSSFPSYLSTQFGAPGGSLSSYGSFSNSGGPPMVAAGLGYQHHLNSAVQSSIGLGNASLPSLASQVPSLGSQPSSLGSQVPSLSSQAPSLASLAPSSLGVSGVGAYPGGGLSGGPYGSSSLYQGSGGYGGLGMGSSLYHTPLGSAGMPSSGYPEGGQFSSSSLYQAQNPQAPGSSPRARIPPGGGMYQSFPHYF